MMQKKSYFNKIDSENYKNNSNNVIDFNSKTQSASVDGKYNFLPDGESENYSIIDNIALECLKKADIKGNTDDVFNEYLKIREKIKQEINSNKTEYKTIDDCDDIYKKTVFDDYIVCLEDGKKMKMLKRHLKTNYNMTFQEYKKKWGLPIDYPYVCKNHSKIRAKIAQKRKKN